VVYDRSAANVERLAAALRPYEPYLRGAPPGRPFTFDASTINRGLNFTLSTTLGDIDLLGEVAGGGPLAQLVHYAEPVELEGRRCLVVGLEKLIALKRAAGRARIARRLRSSKRCWKSGRASQNGAEPPLDSR
jgi:hypothetical protein